VTAADVFRGSGFTPHGDEELWCFDIENIPVRREMSPMEAAEWGRVFDEADEHLRPALCAWVASGDYVAKGDGELPSIGDFEERYAGEWQSFRDYAESFADEIGLLAGASAEVTAYFDWDAWTRDLAFDYTTADAPGGVYVFRSL
jgi:antirestriction protein